MFRSLWSICLPPLLAACAAAHEPPAARPAPPPVAGAESSTRDAGAPPKTAPPPDAGSAAPAPPESDAGAAPQAAAADAAAPDDVPGACRATGGTTLVLEQHADRCKATVSGASVGKGISATLEPAKRSVRRGAPDPITLRFSNNSTQSAWIEIPVRFEMGGLLSGPGTKPRIAVELSTVDAKGRSVDFPSNYGVLGMFEPHDESGVRVLLAPHSAATATLDWAATGYLPDKRYSPGRFGGSPPKDRLRPGRYAIRAYLTGVAGGKVEAKVRVTR